MVEASTFHLASGEQLEGAGLLTAGQAVKDKNFSLSIKILG